MNRRKFLYFLAALPFVPTALVVTLEPKTPVLAYSLARKVCPDYTNAAYRIRRDDGCEMDVGFTPDGKVDYGAARNFLSGKDGLHDSLV